MDKKIIIVNDGSVRHLIELIRENNWINDELVSVVEDIEKWPESKREAMRKEVMNISSGRKHHESK